MSFFTDLNKLITGRFFFTLAVQMQAVIIGWRMYELTRDPLSLGFIGLTAAAPALSLALYAGYLVDQSKPLVIYQRVIATSLLSALVLLVSQLPAMEFNGPWQIFSLYLSSFLTGVARGFAQPAIYAIIPRIVKRKELPHALAWMSSAMQSARIAGPAIGGLLYGWIGIVFTSNIVCIAMTFSLALLYIMKNSPSAPQARTQGKILDELLSGARFVFKHPILFPALTLDMISVLFGGVTALLPIFASEILHAGSNGLGILRASPAIGATLASLMMTRFEIGRRAGPLLFGAVTGFGICILVFALSHSFILSVAALALSGVFDSMSVVIRSTAVQLASPDAMRGRISAVNSIFIGSSNELGEFESGVAAKALGLVPSVVVGAGICLLTVFIAAFASPRLRKLDLTTLGDSEVK